jgi:hypothetical protein
MESVFHLQLTTSVEDHFSLSEQGEIAQQYLQPHGVKLNILTESEKDRRAGVNYQLAPGAEVLEITINSTSVLHALLLGIMGGAGLSIGKIFGKVMEAAADELGKDLYTWVKNSTLAAVRSSKRKNQTISRGERNIRFRLIFHAMLLEDHDEPIVLRVYIPHTYGALSATGEFVDNGVPDQVVIERIEDFARRIVPLVSYIIGEQRESGNGLDQRRVIIEGYVDSTDALRYRWSVILGFCSLWIEYDCKLEVTYLSHNCAVTASDILNMYDIITGSG